MTAITTTQAIAPTLTVIDGTPLTTSTEVAQHFGKLHKDVLEKIASLIAEAPSDFSERNFPPVEYTDAKGERRPAYRLTRDGFTLLAMGFTGKRALAFKIAYIDAFNRMEAELMAGKPSTADRVAASLGAAKFYAECLEHFCQHHKLPQAQAMACRQVKESTGIDLAAIWGIALPAPKAVVNHAERLVSYVANAKAYAGDRRFSDALAAGCMPHSKLLKLMKMKAEAFAQVVIKEIDAGSIKVVGANNDGIFYAVTGA